MAAPVAAREGADGLNIEDALRRARSLERLLLLVLVDGSGSDTSWTQTELRRPEWTDAILPHSQVLVRADENPAVASRLDVTEFPQIVLLDGEGREVGRLKGRQPVDVLAGKVRKMIEAVERFRSSDAALRDNPRDPEALFWVAKYRWNRGDRFLAVACFEKVVDLAGGTGAADREIVSESLRHIAQHSLDCGKYVEAEDLFRRSLKHAQAELDECAARAALGLSMSLRRQKRLPEAIQIIEERFLTARSQQLLDQALFTLGYLYQELGDREKASRNFRACCGRFPKSVYGIRAERYVAFAKTPGAASLPSPETAEDRTAAPGVISTAASIQALTTASFSGSNRIVQELR